MYINRTSAKLQVFSLCRDAYIVGNCGNFQLEILRKEAKCLARMGFSVLPVQGNNLPDHPKQPATMWRRFQRRIASEAEIDSMFSGHITAMGIICGQVSGLMVIDFDDLQSYRKFCMRFPELVRSYTVKTRRGFHVYFRTRTSVRSQKFVGGDIKGERSFVIAPPSIIGDFTYSVAIADAARELSSAEVDTVLNYLQVHRQLSHLATEIATGKRDIDVVAVYRRLFRDIGRNNALYRCASIARQSGYREVESVELLAVEHAVAAVEGKKRESVASRWSEALRTIESAYRGEHVVPAVGRGIVNSVRECLLRLQKSTVLVRLLDIFCLAGWRPGAWFSLGEAIELASAFGLGRNAVLESLVGRRCMHDGRVIIERRYVEYLDIRGLYSGKRGRPIENVYQVPSNSELVSMFGVKWSPADRVDADDVRSAHRYRLALHREYIRRLAPRMPMSWLAERIGVDVRSIRRYNRELSVETIVSVGEFPLSRSCLQSLPKRGLGMNRNSTPGMWLELGNGRRYPAWRHIGSRLLDEAAGAVRVCARGTSQYRLVGGVGSFCYEPLSMLEFVRIREWRLGERSRESLLGGLVASVKDRASSLRYDRVPLFFDTVRERIANDNVADTIAGYVYALDDGGSEIRRPAKRGVAYRMLKEFGEGQVYLALLDSRLKTLYALARHLLGMGKLPAAMGLLARALT